MYKLSKYVFQADFPDYMDNNDLKIVYSTRSSRYMVVEKDVWEKLNDGHVNEIEQSINSGLKECKIIVPNDENELETIIKENIHAQKNNEVLTVVLSPSDWCQLGCHYCGQKHQKQKISADTMNKMLSYVQKLLEDKQKGYKGLSVTWFGAEPLTAYDEILYLSKELIKLSSKKGIKYTSKMVTNGLNLTPKLAQRLIEESYVNFFEVTLDGISFSHDQNRPLRNGQGSFDTIYNNIKNVLNIDNKQVVMSIRCNVDFASKEHISALLRMLKKDNLHHKILLYFAPLHDWGNDAHQRALSMEDFSEYEFSWFLEMQELGIPNIYLLPTRKKINCITVNDHALLIDSDGEIFNCTEVHLVNSYMKNNKNIYSLGNISNGAIDKSKRDEWSNFYSEVLDNNLKCSECPYLPVCGTLCPKNWKTSCGQCPSFKYNFEQRLLLYCALQAKSIT